MFSSGFQPNGRDEAAAAPVEVTFTSLLLDLSLGVKEVRPPLSQLKGDRDHGNTLLRVEGARAEGVWQRD